MSFARRPTAWMFFLGKYQFPIPQPGIHIPPRYNEPLSQAMVGSGVGEPETVPVDPVEAIMRY